LKDGQAVQAVQQGPTEVTGADSELLFTAAQLWHALPTDVFVKCLGSSVLSEDLKALMAARTPVGKPQINVALIRTRV